MTLLGCVGTGVSVCMQYEKHIHALGDLSEMFFNMAEIVSTQKATIPEAIEGARKAVHGIAELFLDNFTNIKQSEEIDAAWKIATEILNDELNESEVEMIHDLLERNVCLDDETQKNALMQIAGRFKNQMLKEEADRAEKKKTVQALSVVCGILVCVVLW